MPSQEPYLICHNQLMLNDVALNDFPRYVSPDGESLHSINLPINDLESVYLQLNLEVVISHLPIRFPTKREVEKYIELKLTSLTKRD